MPSRKFSFTLIILAAVFGGIAAVFAIFHFTNLHLNFSPSFPRGIYRLVERSPKIGELVFFKPPRTEVFAIAIGRGYFAKRDYLIKRLVAQTGDLVTIADSGVTVNGKYLRNSRPLKLDGAGRPLPVARITAYRLGEGEVLLMSDYSPQSFDARYFGVQPTADIRGTAQYIPLGF